MKLTQRLFPSTPRHTISINSSNYYYDDKDAETDSDVLKKRAKPSMFLFYKNSLSYPTASSHDSVCHTSLLFLCLRALLAIKAAVPLCLLVPPSYYMEESWIDLMMQMTETTYSHAAQEKKEKTTNGHACTCIPTQIQICPIQEYSVSKTKPISIGTAMTAHRCHITTTIWYRATTSASMAKGDIITYMDRLLCHCTMWRRWWSTSEERLYGLNSFLDNLFFRNNY